MRAFGIALAALLAAAATGCDSPSTANSANAVILDGAPASPGCVPLTQEIAFSGSATLTDSSAVSDEGASGRLAVGVVKSVAGSGISYGNSNSDGSIELDAQGSQVQGTLQISDGEWSAISSQLSGSQGECIQGMTFDFQVAPSPTGSAYENVVYNGQVGLTVGGQQISISF